MQGTSSGNSHVPPPPPSLVVEEKKVIRPLGRLDAGVLAQSGLNRQALLSAISKSKGASGKLPKADVQHYPADRKVKLLSVVKLDESETKINLKDLLKGAQPSGQSQIQTIKGSETFQFIPFQKKAKTATSESALLLNQDDAKTPASDVTIPRNLKPNSELPVLPQESTIANEVTVEKTPPEPQESKTEAVLTTADLQNFRKIRKPPSNVKSIMAQKINSKIAAQRKIGETLKNRVQNMRRPTIKIPEKIENSDTKLIAKVENDVAVEQIEMESTSECLEIEKSIALKHSEAEKSLEVKQSEVSKPVEVVSKSDKPMEPKRVVETVKVQKEPPKIELSKPVELPKKTTPVKQKNLPVQKVAEPVKTYTAKSTAEDNAKYEILRVPPAPRHPRTPLPVLRFPSPPQTPHQYLQRLPSSITVQRISSSTPSPQQSVKFEAVVPQKQVIIMNPNSAIRNAPYLDARTEIITKHEELSENELQQLRDIPFIVVPPASSLETVKRANEVRTVPDVGVTMKVVKQIKKESDSLVPKHQAPACKTYSREQRGTKKVNIPFQFKGERVHNFTLTSITVPNLELEKNLVDSCRNLKNKIVGSVVKLHADKDENSLQQENDLHGFSSDEIETSVISKENKKANMMKVMDRMRTFSAGSAEDGFEIAQCDENISGGVGGFPSMNRRASVPEVNSSSNDFLSLIQRVPTKVIVSQTLAPLGSPKQEDIRKRAMEQLSEIQNARKRETITLKNFRRTTIPIRHVEQIKKENPEESATTSKQASSTPAPIIDSSPASAVSDLLKSSFLEMRKKLSENRSADTTSIDLVLNKLNDQTFLNEMVEFAKSKISESATTTPTRGMSPARAQTPDRETMYFEPFNVKSPPRQIVKDEIVNCPVDEDVEMSQKVTETAEVVPVTKDVVAQKKVAETPINVPVPEIPQPVEEKASVVATKPRARKKFTVNTNLRRVNQSKETEKETVTESLGEVVNSERQVEIPDATMKATEDPENNNFDQPSNTVEREHTEIDIVTEHVPETTEKSQTLQDVGVSVSNEVPESVNHLPETPQNQQHEESVESAVDVSKAIELKEVPMDVETPVEIPQVSVPKSIEKGISRMFRKKPVPIVVAARRKIKPALVGRSTQAPVESKTEEKICDKPLEVIEVPCTSTEAPVVVSLPLEENIQQETKPMETSKPFVPTGILKKSSRFEKSVTAPTSNEKRPSIEITTICEVPSKEKEEEVENEKETITSGQIEEKMNGKEDSQEKVEEKTMHLETAVGNPSESPESSCPAADEGVDESIANSPEEVLSTVEVEDVTVQEPPSVDKTLKNIEVEEVKVDKTHKEQKQEEPCPVKHILSKKRNRPESLCLEQSIIEETLETIQEPLVTLVRSTRGRRSHQVEPPAKTPRTPRTRGKQAVEPVAETPRSTRGRHSKGNESPQNTREIKSESIEPKRSTRKSTIITEEVPKNSRAKGKQEESESVETFTESSKITRATRNSKVNDVDEIVDSPRNSRAKRRKLDTTDEPKDKSRNSIESRSSSRGKRSRSSSTFASESDAAKTRKRMRIDSSSDDDEPLVLKKAITPRSGSGYTCGNCKENVVKSKWFAHRKGHAALAWREGIDEPINLSNEDSWVNVMQKFIKENNLPYLSCPKCKEFTRKSGAGLISHMRICGLSKDQLEQTRVPCPNCNKSYVKDSLATHLRSHCPVLKEKYEEERMEIQRQREIEEEQKEAVEDELTDSGRAKRQSRKKAEENLKSVWSDQVKIFDAEMYLGSKAKKITGGIFRVWRTALNKSKPAKCMYNCEHTSQTVEEAQEHHRKCPAAAGFCCTICGHRSNYRVEVIEHIKTMHSVVETTPAAPDFQPDDSDATVGEESSESEGTSGSEESDIESEEDDEDDFDDDESCSDDNRRDKKQRKLIDRNSNCHRVPDTRIRLFKSLVTRYTDHDRPKIATQKYRELNFTQLAFEDLKVRKINLLPIRTRHLYEVFENISRKIACKFTKSYSVDSANEQISEWKTFKLYQGAIMNDSPIFFCGGPIRAIEWLPLPSNSDIQILAVATSPSYAPTKISQVKPVKCLIQLWSMEKFTNSNVPRLNNPKLMYSLAIENGPVNDLKFCPSGGHTDDRLGLLAVASCCEDISIYALPKEDSNVFELAETHQAISLEPCLVLKNYGKVGGYATKLAWSSGKGHTTFVAGYSNGFVLVWNLGTQSKLLNKVQPNGIREIYSHRSLVAHLSHITALCLHPIEGLDFLVTGSLDRRLKVFRCEDGYDEVVSVFNKSRVVCAQWSPAMPFFPYGVDADYCFQQSEVRTIMTPGFAQDDRNNGPLITLRASVTDVSVNEWTNLVGISSSVGDVCMYHSQDYFAEPKKRRHEMVKIISSYVDEVKVDSTEVGTSETSRIVFNDLDKDKNFKIQGSNFKLRAEDITHDSLVRANKIVFNPNENAYNCYAIGYESGFVRLRKALPI